MKKLLWAIILTLGISTWSYAQDFKLGLKAGINFTNLKTDNAWLNSESKNGYVAGVWGRIGGNKFHFQPEAYFSSKQVTFNNLQPEDAASELVSGDLKFSNIDIPLLIGTKIPLGPIKAKLQAGPLFSFVLNQEASYRESVEQSYNDALNNYKDRFSAIVVGTGFDIGNFALDARYEYGLGNISKYEGRKQSMNLWTISLGFSFL